MKRNLFLLITGALLSFLSSAQEKLSGKYSIKMDVKSLPDKPGKLHYSYYNTYTRESFSDSVEIKDDNDVKIKGSLEEPVLMALRYVSTLDPKSRKIKMGNTLLLYAEPGDITIMVNDSLANAIVKGSQSHLEYQKLAALRKPYDTRQNALYSEYSAISAKKDTAALKLKEAEIDGLTAEMIKDLYKPYYKENAAKTPVAIRALRSIEANTEEEFTEVENLIKLMPAPYQALPSAKTIAEGIVIGRKTAIGAIAIDFAQNDTLDNPVKLSSFRGKYVLLDFWASWCGPCRRENPNLVKSFHKYKDKGFTVFGVSLDQPGKKDRWIKAIHDDKLEWTHVSDLKYWANDIAKKYNINSIPASFLIDPQGRIIAKNLRGEALDQKLEEVLGR